MSPRSDAHWMSVALALGRRGLGRVHPWPSVGCVLVRDGRVVGRGTSDAQTVQHAEAIALARAGPLARGATAYVTLEPCAHHGRTPPCAEALSAAGVVRVVSAMEDPNPIVAGRGHATLRAAGLAVEVGLCADEARRDQAGFLSMIERGRPWLTLKLATSFDGRIATATGESRWITGPAARHMVHSLRSRHDAVLIGGGTARADDPSLTVRELGIEHQTVRIVASRHLDLPTEGTLARTANRWPLWICHGPDADPARVAAWTARGALCLPVAIGAGGQLDPAGLLAALGTRGLTRVFCEGGGAFAASLLVAGVVDEAITMTAGLALGAEGRPALGALGLDTLAAAPRFRLADLRALGPDVMATWRP